MIYCEFIKYSNAIQCTKCKLHKGVNMTVRLQPLNNE